MEKKSFTVGVPDVPRGQALIDGTVGVDGFEVQVVHNFENVGDRHGRMLHGELDAAEMSTTSFIQSRVLGLGEPQLALPVFFKRGLRLRNIIVNRDSGFRHPSELKGKRIAVSRFSATTIVLVCGMLEEDYGVPMESVQWITAEEEHVKVDNPRVRVRHLGVKRLALLNMLIKGEIDAAIFPGYDDYHSIYGGGENETPIDDYGELRSLVDDPAAILDYFRRTKIYPIIHTVTVKESVARAYPEFGPRLLDAFRQAKELAINYEDEEEKHHSAIERRDLGWDPYMYTLGDIEVRSMEALIRYLYDQRLINRPVDLAELFVPGSI